MTIAKRYIRLTAVLIIGLQFGLQAVLPVQLMAQEATSPGSSTTTTPPTPATGPSSPTGADAPTYVYNPETGYYENGIYAWDPATGKTMPLANAGYTYDEDSGRWNTTTYVYHPASNTYEERQVPVDEPPVNQSSPQTVSNTQKSSPSSAATGPASNTEIGSQKSTKTDTDIYTQATINNAIVSNANSGDVYAGRNTKVGNLTSGDASATANVLNSLQSTYLPGGSGQILRFNANIEGDVFGDLIVDPGAATGPDSRIRVEDIDTRDVSLNVRNDMDLNNTIELNANSGDVTAEGNTEAGNLMSGNAQALANVVNILNSAISAGDSFIGSININGNLEGDILLPDNFLDQVLAQTGPDSVVHLSNQEKAELLARIDYNVAINNSISSHAESGAVTADSNTRVGNAQSGNASTDVTIVNVTGKQVIGANSMLVFVNVGGEWLGLIMDSPNQTRAALLTGGTGPDSTYSASTAKQNNLEADVQNNFTINNNLVLTAESGDVTARKNTMLGDIQSGNARTQANIANFTNSLFDLSGWLGILYINIAGNWHGSFGVDTPYGDPVAGTGAVPNDSPLEAPTAAKTTPPENQQPRQTFSFRPASIVTNSGGSSGSGTQTGSQAVTAQTTEVRSASQAVTPSSETSKSSTTTQTTSSLTSTMVSIGLISLVAFVLLSVGDRLLYKLRTLLF